MVVNIDPAPKLSRTQNNLGMKVEGDIQIVDQDSETDEDSAEDQHNDNSKNIVQCPVIPPNLVKNRSETLFSSGVSAVVQNSENVHFGNNTYFNGPVTIKHTIVNSKSGVNNSSYVKTDPETSAERSTDTKLNEETTKKKVYVKNWHKLLICATSVVLIGCICAIVLLTYRNTEERQISSPSGLDSKPTFKVLGSCNENTFLISHIFLISCMLLSAFYLLLTTKKSCQYLCIPSDKSKACSTMLDSKQVDPLLIAKFHLRIVSRTDWLAQPVEEPLEVLKHPAPWVIITHTATEGCNTQSSCVLNVRLIQMFHIESRKWSDIGYNYLIGGDGSAYFGRGWDYVGAHTKGYNRFSIGIAFIGTFNNESPPQKQVEACQKLIQLGVAEGKIAADYKLFAHRQLMSTLSPGDKVYNIIKEWPHFVNESADIQSLIPK